MNVNCFVLLLISVYFSSSFGRINNVDYIDPTNENHQQEIINQFEDKMKALFAIWKTETNRKLESLEQMIPDLEENINRKLYNLRTSILDKLEEYIDNKVNNLERNIPEKLKENMHCHSEVLNKKIEEFEDNFNLKLVVLVKNISQELDGNINCKPEAFKKITELEDNMNRKFEDLVEKIPMTFENNLNSKIDALTNNITREFEANNDFKSDVLKKITHLEDIISRKLAVLDQKIPTKLEEKINLKLDAVAKNISFMQFNKNYTCNAFKNETDYVIGDPGVGGNASAPAVNITEKPRLPCREELVANGRYTQVFSIDDVSLYHYVTQKRNSTGHLTYLELHFAAQADAVVSIDLTEKEDFWGIRYVLDVGMDSQQRTGLYFGNGPKKYAQYIDTPDILSSNAFRAFYIIIDEGKLQFGKEGDTPLILNSVSGFGSLKYYTFSSWFGSAKFRYCPAAVEGNIQ